MVFKDHISHRLISQYSYKNAISRSFIQGKIYQIKIIVFYRHTRTMVSRKFVYQVLLNEYKMMSPVFTIWTTNATSNDWIRQNTKQKYLKELKIIFLPDKQILMMTRALHYFWNFPLIMILMKWKINYCRFQKRKPSTLSFFNLLRRNT